MYNEIFENFFRELHLVCGVNLVFFCRPYLNKMKEAVILEAYDRVKEDGVKKYREEQAKETHLFPWHLDKRFLFNLMQICPKYGDAYTELNPKIIDYAHKNWDNMLAMIQDDTDFLIYDNIQYQYWSLADLDISQFTTKVFRHEILYKVLDLTPPQCRLLSAISRLKGDDFDKWLKSRHTKCNRPRSKLFKMAEYVQHQHISHENDSNLTKIVHDIYGNNYSKNIKGREKLKHELKRYNLQIQDETVECKPFSQKLVSFCKTNLYFVYGLLVEDVTSNESLTYIDLRQPKSRGYIEAIVIMLLRMCGILFKDVKDKTRKIEIKRSQDGHADPIEESIAHHHPPST